jgi:hypothetical protein
MLGFNQMGWHLTWVASFTSSPSNIFDQFRKISLQNGLSLVEIFSIPTFLSNHTLYDIKTNGNGLMSVVELDLKYQITNTCMFYNSLLSCLPRFWKRLIQTVLTNTDVSSNLDQGE